jgi:hypothetical protein
MEWLSFFAGFGVAYALAGVCFFYLTALASDPNSKQMMRDHPFLIFLVALIGWPFCVLGATMFTTPKMKESRDG